MKTYKASNGRYIGRSYDTSGHVKISFGFDGREGNFTMTAAEHEALAEFFQHSKPWHDAKTGEVWVITVGGEESAWTVNNKDKFENPDSTYELTNPTITAARRIWPVSDD